LEIIQFFDMHIATTYLSRCNKLFFSQQFRYRREK